MKKLLHIGIVLPFLSSLFFFAPPTHALTTYFQDDFSNGINSQTPPQVDPTNYTSPNAFFYNIPDFTYDNTEGVWSNGGQSAGTVLKATSINQNNYCAGQALVRNGNDNRTYGAISINTTNQNDGYVFNADLHWDSGIIEELSIYQPNVGYLYINHTTQNCG